MSTIELDADGTATVGNLRLRMEAEQELDLFDPRDNTNLGVMVCSHKRYNLGDHRDPLVQRQEPKLLEAYEEGGPKAVADYAKRILGAYVVLPLYLIDHSGLSMRAGRDFSDVDPGNWDSGLVGFIFDTPKGRDETGVEGADVEQALRAEVTEYDRWLQGDVWCYVIERLVTCSHGDTHAEIVDACGGYIGHEYATQAALEAFTHELKEENDA
jgi:hypothetical protein